MTYPKGYINYLIYFHCLRDYFECHEVLEDHWKQDQEKNHIWVGLIQLAVSLYHYRRGNNIGAKRMLETATFNIQKYPVTHLGIDQKTLLLQMDEINKRCELNLPFEDMNLPIIDIDLLKHCEDLCVNSNIVWGAASANDPYLIHKHKLRDRTEVISERINSLKKRKLNDV